MLLLIAGELEMVDSCDIVGHFWKKKIRYFVSDCGINLKLIRFYRASYMEQDSTDLGERLSCSVG